MGNVSSLLFHGGFSEKVKLLCISDSAETLSLRIQLDYSGQALKINQNISAFSERAPELPEIYNNCIVTAATLASTEQDGGLTQNMLFLFRYKLHEEWRPQRAGWLSARCPTPACSVSSRVEKISQLINQSIDRKLISSYSGYQLII